MFTIQLFQIKAEDTICKNADKIKKLVKKSRADLLVFPELSLTGYKLDQLLVSQEVLVDSINSRLREIQSCVREGQTLLLGAPCVRNDKVYNAVYRITKDELEVISEKQMLFPGIDDVFTQGEVKKIFNFKGVKVGVVLCFELRAPEFFRKFLKEGVDLVFVLAEWPLARISHWEVLLKARAIENKIFVIGVNSLGYSMIVSPEGKVLNTPTEKEVSFEFTYEPFDSELPYPIKTPFFKPTKNKVKALKDLKEIVEFRRKKGQKMVFTNGCFDILHAGHVDYLEKARALGDFLVVGLNSDSSIKKIKGKSRPVNPEVFRVQVLSGIEAVDYIVIFEEETPEKLIKELKPDVLVKGADWEESKIVGANFVKSYGGKVERIKFAYEISTTAIIEKISKGGEA